MAGEEKPNQRASSRREFLVEMTGLAAGTAALGGTLQAAQSDEIELVRNGRSRYSILLSPKASLSEQRGAHELQHFLQEMSGAELPITTGAASGSGPWVFVGQSAALDALKPGIPYEKLGAEGFAIKTIGNNVAIAGGRERGTMYGVSTFLEKLGCRWFTKDVSRIPRRATITIAALDETQLPGFYYRLPYVTEGFDKDWAARNKVNVGIKTGLDASTGGAIHYYPLMFYRLVPPKKYFATHPEYYSLIDGKRTHRRGQLCLTNQGLLRVATQRVLEQIKEHPDARTFPIWQNDSGHWCKCDNCQRVVKEEGSVSGLLLRFINAIAEQVAERYPGKMIDTMAYKMTEDPPRITRPRSNVSIRICPIGNCEAHSIATCPHNVHMFKNLRGWAAITKQIYVWHYTTNFSNYLLPYPDFDELAADAELYRRHNVIGIFFEDDGEPGGGGQGSALRAYVMARLLWNPKVDVARDIQEFHHAYYGRAAGPMLAYHRLLQRLVRFSPQGEGQHIFIRRSPVFSPQDHQEAEKLLDQAERLASNDAVLHRVRKERLTVDYAALVASRRFVASHGQYAPVDLPALTKRFRSYMTRLKQLGNYRLHTSRSNEQAQELFAAHMRPYALTQLENDSLQVNVAPELSGRIVGIIEKSSGRNVLRHAAPEELWQSINLWNPNFGGLSVSLHEDFRNRHEMDVDWQLDPASRQPQVCRMTGKTGAGLQLEHTVELASSGASLRTHTRVVNKGIKPITFALKSTLDPNPVDRNAPMEFDIDFRARNGKKVSRHYSSLTQEFLGDEHYLANKLPAGEWRLKHRLLALEFITRFDLVQVDRCTASWRARGENWILMGVWSPRRTLDPGQSLELGVSYHIQASSMVDNV